MSQTKPWMAMVAMVVVATACSSSSSGVTHCGAGGFDAGMAPLAESMSGGCTTMPILLVGTKKAGDPCDLSSECASTCCACGVGVESASAALCVNGTCATANETCCAFASLGATPEQCQ